MGGTNTRAALDCAFVNFRKIKRAKRQRAKLYNPSTESSTLTVRGKGYSTAKKNRKDDHRRRMITKQSKSMRERTLTQKIQKAETAQAKSKMSD